MKSFKSPDLNGPRYRIEKEVVDDNEFYKNFYEKYPEHRKYSIKELRKIIHNAHGALYKTVIDHRDGIELPEGLGYVFIASCALHKKKRNVDFARSKQYGMVVDHKNWETDGRVCDIVYTNYPVKYKIKDNNIWGFTAIRYFSRAASAAFRNNHLKYIIVDNEIRISRLFQRAKDKDYYLRRTEERLENYNEFDI